MLASTSNQTAQKLHMALEKCDLNMMVSCFNDDCALEVIDQNHPPSRSLKLNGKKAISEYYKDIFGRKMTHRIDQEIVGDSQIAFTESCLYPDGTRVVAAEVFELSADGKINRQTNVQAWDA